jgi:hypothetical protein
MKVTEEVVVTPAASRAATRVFNMSDANYFTCWSKQTPEGSKDYVGSGPNAYDAAADYLVFVENWKSGSGEERIRKYGPLVITEYRMSSPDDDVASAVEVMREKRLFSATFGQRTLTKLGERIFTRDELLELLKNWLSTT